MFGPLPRIGSDDGSTMNITTHLTGLALGDHLKKLPADPTRSISTPGSLLTVALLLAFLLAAPAAHAEETAPGDPGEIIIVIPPVETPAPEPAPPEPAPPEQETPPTDTAVPAPATELPPATPAAPSFNQRPAAPPAVQGIRNGILLPHANTKDTPLPETAAPTPEPITPSATPPPAAAAATATPAVVPTSTPGPHAASTELHAVSAMAEGSPLAVQLLTVLALLGAGLVYFRTLGSKRFRRPAGARK